MKTAKNFELKFASTYPEFTKNLVLKIHDTSPQEIKICMCIKMSFTNTQTRQLLKISESTIANLRSGIRKKLALKRAESLSNTILLI